MEVFDVENGYSTTNSIEGHTPLCKFKRRFELQSVCNDFKFVNVNIKPVPFIYGFRLEQYDVDVILNKLNFHLKIICSTFIFNGFIRTLKIKIYNTNKQKELASCTNFLQRQKNLHLALNVLRKCSKSFEDRKFVLQTITNHHPEYLIVTKTDDSGYCIRCVDNKRNFTFFESNWSIGWNYRNYNIFDFIDFMLNNKDKLFNVKVKPIMRNLTYPHNTVNVKLQLWNEIMHCVKTCVDSKNSQDEQCSCSYSETSLPDTSSLCLTTGKNKYKKKLLENKDLYLIHPEIIEIIDSDDESLEINNESDNDVMFVTYYPGNGCSSRSDSTRVFNGRRHPKSD